MPTADTPLTVEELERLLHAADPAVLLVPPRLLRRVIKQDRNLGSIGLQVPHRKSYVLGRERLLRVATPEELALPAGRELPEKVILLGRPLPDTLTQLPRGTVLVKFWRMLFHARVHLALDERWAKDGLSEASFRERIRRIGQTEFDEIRQVLRQEKYVLPPGDDRTVYGEFAAVFLELSHFAPPLLPRYFPSLGDFARIERQLNEDVDANALFVHTRPVGAPDPVIRVDVPDEEDDEPAGETVDEEATAPRSETRYRILSLLADRASAAGNVVGAGVRRERAACQANAALAGQAHAAAREELEKLVPRLQAALSLSDAEAEAWREALPGLIVSASRGLWPVEARLLYDLQKVCIDRERTIYSPDLIEWAYAHFRRPLVHPLLHLPDVLVVKHLRSALSRMPSARIADDARQRLAALLRTALHHAEARLRERFRPLLEAALRDVGLAPATFVERVARDKLIEELLDRIAERGLLRMGDLRDALSRNRLKLADLSGPDEFFRGDPLVRANRKLTSSLDGVYRRGEFYLRWLQRLSSLAFGTQTGRFLTKYLALPFGGAFVALEGLQHMVEPVARLLHGAAPAADELEELVEAEHVHLLNVYSWLGVGGVLFLLLHVAPLRHALARGLVLAWRGLRAVLLDLPSTVLRMPMIRKVLDSVPYLLLHRYLIKPLVLAAGGWELLWLLRLRALTTPVSSLLLFLACAVFVNSRPGRRLEEWVADWGVRSWHRLSADWLPGLFRFVMSVFKQMVDTVESFLYTGDEWLRFRHGGGRGTLAAKTVLGLVWFIVSYLVRVFINLFVEPTFNPIKHFPVVTVAAKMLLPMAPIFGPAITSVLNPVLGTVLSGALAGLMLFFLPGIAGFAVWELKENWRLYRTNQAPTLQPVVIGHHGETMAGLLKPGFHSGTLPRLYAKLRRAERRAYQNGKWRAARKQRAALHHVEESVRHFVEREFLALLNGSKRWHAGRVTLGPVELGSNRIAIELCCPTLAADSLELSFEEQSGWLLAGVAHAGWLSKLSDEEHQVFATATGGLYQLAAIELIRGKIEAFLPSGAAYDITDAGLVVWPGPGYEAEVVYDLRGGPMLTPRVAAGQTDDMPVLTSDQLFASENAITWCAWTAIWERDQVGKAFSSEKE